jgi:hypothetical protein
LAEFSHPFFWNRERRGGVFVSREERSIAMFRVYSGPSGGKQRISPLEKERLLFKEFASLDEAFGWAGHIADTGRSALLIEGDDGTQLNAHEIADALHQREDMAG